MSVPRFASVLLAVLLGSSAPALADEGSKNVPTAPSRVAAAPGLEHLLPWLGVSMDKGGDTGVRVEHVVRGSPAERGGLRAGDRIVSLDGTRVTAPGQVSRVVAARKVGGTVMLGLERAGTAIAVPVVLGVRPTSHELLRMDLVGALAPAWTNVTPIGGAPSSVASLRGKVALIDFWASWCGPCRMIAPRLSALKDRLGAQGLVVVGVTTDGADEAATFAERHRMRYPIVADGDGATSRAYGITSLPTMVLVDKNGVVREVFVGFDPDGDAALEASVRKLLAEPLRRAPAAADTPAAKAEKGEDAPAANVPRPVRR